MFYIYSPIDNIDGGKMRNLLNKHKQDFMFFNGADINTPFIKNKKPIGELLNDKSLPISFCYNKDGVLELFNLTELEEKFNVIQKK